MKKKLVVSMIFLSVLTLLVGCSKDNPLTIWVGSESVDFYQEMMDTYVTDYATENGEDFPYEVKVVGVDTGSAAATFLEDTDAGADIFTVAHDNLGKLTSGSSSIAPITDPDLLAQIAEDNPEIFLDVIKNTVDGTTYTFGVPYIAQSLILYYNTQYITEEQAQSWEGIWDAAKAVDKYAMTVTDTDGYNNSFLLLSTVLETGYTSLQLYEDGDIDNNYVQGDDRVATMKWGQRFFTDENGGKRASDSGWEVELKDGITLSVISGAWDYEAAKSALGDNLGIVKLPTFTLTADDAYGDFGAGTVFQSGSFTDTKVFVMKKASDKADYLQDILKYLSSSEMQEASFNQEQNLPAYKNALDEFTGMQADTLEATLASSQLEMFDYGIPQPFGYSTTFNFYFYSKGAPDYIYAILVNEDGLYGTDQAIYDQLGVIQNIWKTGSAE
ncbi:MAG: extracellular solute-binding protein [Acholeplasmataceae bacterium]